MTRSDVHTSVLTDEEGRPRTVHWQTTQEPIFGPDGQVRHLVQRAEDEVRGALVILDHLALERLVDRRFLGDAEARAHIDAVSTQRQSGDQLLRIADAA